MQGEEKEGEEGKGGKRDHGGHRAALFPECRRWPPWGSDLTTWRETLQLAGGTLRAQEVKFHSRVQI